MAFLNLRLSAEMLDQLVPDLPYVRRREYDEVRAFSFDQATGGGYQSAPLTGLTTIQALILIPDKAVTVRVAGQATAGAAIDAGGLYMLVGSSIDNSGGTGVQIDNSSGTTVNIRGLALGT
jgi:hypothetical protein